MRARPRGSRRPARSLRPRRAHSLRRWPLHLDETGRNRHRSAHIIPDRRAPVGKGLKQACPATGRDRIVARGGIPPDRPAGSATPPRGGIGRTENDRSPSAGRPRTTCFDHFHVLLRHRLLRQPHGFEGFGVVQIHLYADRPPALQRRDRRDLARERDPLAWARPARSASITTRSPKSMSSEGCTELGTKNLGPSRNVLAKPLRTAIGARRTHLDELARRVRLEVAMAGEDSRVNVAAVERLHPSADASPEPRTVAQGRRAWRAAVRSGRPALVTTKGSESPSRWLQRAALGRVDDTRQRAIAAQPPRSPATSPTPTAPRRRGPRTGCRKTPVDYPPVLEGGNVGVTAHWDLDARRAPAHALDEEHDHAVSRVNQLVLEAQGLHAAGPLLPPTKHRVLAPVDLGDIRHGRLGGIPLDFWVQDFASSREPRFPASFVFPGEEVLNYSAPDLHVLLRHRRPSIPPSHGPGEAAPQPAARTPRYLTSQTHQVSGVLGRGAGDATTPTAPCHPGVPRCEKDCSFLQVMGHSAAKLGVLAVDGQR